MCQVFYYKVQQFYYKTQQVLQYAMIFLENATFITKCNLLCLLQDQYWNYIFTNIIYKIKNEARFSLASFCKINIKPNFSLVYHFSDQHWRYIFTFTIF